MASESAPSVLDRLRRLCAAAESLTAAGDSPGAEGKCREASQAMMQFALLCQEQPQLQAEAAPLYERLKRSVARLKRGRPPPSAAQAEAAALADAMPDDNPFSERNVLKSFRSPEAHLLEMQARETEMNRLAKDMVALEEMFSDLNKIVYEQGERLQLIEDHVNVVEVEVTSGTEKLETAVKHQRSSRKKKIIIIVIVVAAVIVLSLILYLVLSRVL